nr:hypothetical protein [uncultured Draconibacterium sp.]
MTQTANNTKYFLHLFVILSLIVNSCSDFIEEDLGDKAVQLQSPINELETKSTAIRFLWKDIEGAQKYNLQVINSVLPKNNSLLLDTIIEDNSCNYILPPGKYQWRVNALNKVSQTPFSQHSLTILIPYDISKDQVELLSPSENEICAENKVNFEWTPVENATGYNIIIKKDDWNTGTELINDYLSFSNLTTTLADGKYVWGVSAVDSIHEKSSSYSIRELEIDKFGPAAPTPLFPVGDTILNNDQVKFSWKSTEESVRYKLFIYNTPNDTEPIFTAESQDTSYLHQFSSENTYYWKVVGYNKNDKIGTYSNLVSFSLKKEEILTDKSVEILFPTEGLKMDEAVVSFLWNEVDGANAYHVQIVSPTFDDPVKLIYDQQLESNHFEIELEGGEYEARILASDGITSTPYNTVKFSITSFSDKKAKFSFPTNNSTLNYSDLTIAWNQIENATNYHLQIVSPDFSSPEKLIYDDWITTNKVNLNLATGLYQACIQATNGSLFSKADTIHFEISNNSLSETSLHLLAPDNNKLINQKNITFNWEQLDGDVKYEFILKNGNWDDENLISKFQTDNTQTSLSLDEGSYSWGVKAIDKTNGSETTFSSRAFSIDVTPPNPPILISPTHNATLKDYSVTFSWDDGSSSSEDNTYEWELFKISGNGATPMASENTTNTSFGYSLNDEGTYQWRVRTKDLAGNQSVYSASWDFTINNGHVADLSDKSTVILAPKDSLVTTATTHTFWWEKLDGAEKYNFQLVTPSFDSIESLIEDTSLTDNQITLTVPPGKYQWRVKGINSISQTGYSTYTLIINPSE